MHLTQTHERVQAAEQGVARAQAALLEAETKAWHTLISPEALVVWHLAAPLVDPELRALAEQLIATRKALATAEQEIREAVAAARQAGITYGLEPCV